MASFPSIVTVIFCPYSTVADFATATDGVEVRSLVGVPGTYAVCDRSRIWYRRKGGIHGKELRLCLGPGNEYLAGRSKKQARI
jgi:hypothetical protein